MVVKVVTVDGRHIEGGVDVIILSYCAAVKRRFAANIVTVRYQGTGLIGSVLLPARRWPRSHILHRAAYLTCILFLLIQ